MALRPIALLKRSLIFVHRWLGVALALVFILWFVSGIVMMYWTFPGITGTDRLQRAPTLDTSRLTLTPEQAYATLGRGEPPSQVRLASYDGRPVYRFAGGRGGGRGGGGGRGRGGGATMVYADDGSKPPAVDDAMVDRAAAAWAGRPVSEATKVSVKEADQWTVEGNLRSMRPLYKYSWPDGQQAYLNGTTGEVVQYTTTSSRFWAWLGAIPHWMYFTQLRVHQREWFAFVVWSSLIGTVAALMGVVIAIWMYSPRMRYRHAGMPTSIPYTGWKRWHTIIGLFFGVMTTTWAFSGLLSMGPFPIIDKLTDLTVPPPADQPRGRGGRGGGGAFASALRGAMMPLESYAARPPAAALAAVPDFQVKELEYTSFAGEPVYMATDGGGRTRIIPVEGEPKESFDAGKIMRRVKESPAGRNLAELRMMDEYDAYYLHRRGARPLPVIYARMNDSVGTRYYIDPKTATIAVTYSSRGWVNRWLYHGLHSFDFPWLYNYRPLWDIVVISLMLGGTALCVTSLMLAWRVLARKLARVWESLRPPNEDLAPIP
jgi:hypothetical protein